MPTFYDSNKKPYILTQEIGRGGEGTVFFCPNDLSLVAKIYHEAIDAEKAEKLRWMAANKNEGLLKIAAWLVDVLMDRDGKIVGFLMPNVKAKEIHELYSLKSRRVHFPQATWQFLIHTAANVARAFYVLHKNDHIMGDVNHGNLVVLADGRVNLIDCDSYSIKTDQMRYTCEVGVATHLAPELQGVDLSEVVREKTHDNFGLAVIIFQLLFLGRHPFSGNYLGAEDKSLEDCIRERRFAFGNQSVTNVKQPPGTLSLSQIPTELAQMFTSAFMTQNRPEPREWIEALEDLSKNLQTCNVHVGHHYSNNLADCPWCRMEAKTGLILFPLIGNNELGEGKFNILTVENLVNQMAPSQNLPLQPAQFQYVAKSSAEALNCRKNKRTKIASIILAQFLILTFCTFVFGAALTFFLGLIGLGITAYIFSEQHKVVKNQFQRNFYTKQQSWQEIEIEWNNFNSSAGKFNIEVSKIKRQVNEYRKLQEDNGKQIKQLSGDAYQQELKLYLSTFSLADLKDPLIEKVHYEIFNRYNLKTAADVDENRLQSLLAINARIKAVINQWRKTLESQFTLETNDLLPVTTKSLIEFEYQDKRQDIESNIEKLLGNLRSTSTALQQAKAKLANNAEKSYREVIQAQRDLMTVGGSASLSVMMILMTIFVPTFGSIINRFLNVNQRNSQNIYSVPATNSASYGSNVSTRAVPAEDYSNYVVNENLTDAEIERMSADQRYKSAQSLYLQALPLMNDKLYVKAENKLQLAIKFMSYDTNILYSLATVYYEQGKFDESLKVLQKSLKFDSNTEQTKLLIGANYMRLKRYSESINIFTEISTDNPKSFEAQFNLGLCFKYLQKYATANMYFNEAIEIKPNDIDAHYEYGFSLYKTGSLSGANSEYQKLLNLGAEKEAEKLRKIIGVEKLPTVRKEIRTVSGNDFDVGEEDLPPPPLPVRKQ